MFKDLEKISKEIQILLVPQIEIRNGKDIWIAEGMAVQKTKKDKIINYTILNYNCDDIAKGLLHETMHHYYPTAEEIDIKIFTDLLWKKPDYKSLFQDKIVKILGDYDL